MDPRESGPGAGTEAILAPAVLRQVLRRLDVVLALLESDEEDPVRTVHGCRRALKRVRAGLRLLQDSGQTGLTGHERACRDVARVLSPLRDADAGLACLRRMGRAVEDPATLAELRALATAIRAERAGRSLDPRTAGGLARRLEAVRGALAEADVSRLADDALLETLDHSHARARRAWRRALSEDIPEAWHALRKKAKRELYQLAVLEPSLGPARRARMPRLDALCDALGAYQDLWVVSGHAAAAGMATQGPLGQALATRLDDARRHCRRTAAVTYG